MKKWLLIISLLSVSSLSAMAFDRDVDVTNRNYFEIDESIMRELGATEYTRSKQEINARQQVYDANPMSSTGEVVIKTQGGKVVASEDGIISTTETTVIPGKKPEVKQSGSTRNHYHHGRPNYGFKGKY